MRVVRWLWIALALVGFSTATLAQAPGAPGGDFARFRQQMEKFREQHKYTIQLTNTLAALREMDAGTKCPLTPDQAKKILAAIAPYKTKAKFTQDDAKTVLKNIKAVLTTKQLTELGQITKRMEERRRGPGAGGPGGGGPGAGRPGGGGPGGEGARPGAGGPPGGGERRRFSPPDFAKMKDYNPFAKPAAEDRFSQRRYERVKAALDALEKKAKQKK